MLVVSAPALAGEPPNPVDPCAKAGRDACGTTGVGFYKRYRYGLRWFGDYRVIPGEPHTFCVDLRYWYPSRDSRWVEVAGPLRNRDGEPVPAAAQQKLAYAIWAFGRSSSRVQQAAVMLYVHSLMGDARPGEVDPAVGGAAVAARFAAIASAAERYHGPYRLDVRQASDGRSATVRVVSASGAAVPDVPLRVAAGDDSPQARTGSDGEATVRLRPATAAGATLAVQATQLASTLPTVLTPAEPAAAANTQRLAVPTAQTIGVTVRRPLAKAELTVSTAASPARIAAGESVSDRVTITGAPAGWSATVKVRVHGPFASAGDARCDGAPAWEGTFRASGSGVYTTPPATLSQPGYYTFQEVVPGDERTKGLTTPCGVASESFRVEVQPTMTSTASSAAAAVGTPVFDRVLVSGLSGQTVTIKAALYGPFPTRAAISCTGSPVWSATMKTAANGEVDTPPFTPTVAGYYAYVETIAASGLVRGVETACGDVAESFVARAKPELRTWVSGQKTAPGATVTDSVVVSGLGALSVPIRVELWGPFATQSAIRCTGTPFWKGVVTAVGDGTYTTPPVALPAAGYYTFVETIAATPASAAATSTCGDVAETTLVRATPTVTTVAAHDVVKPGSTLFDRIEVRGLGTTKASIEVELYGPFGTRAAISCARAPLWKGRVTVEGNGVYRSTAVQLKRVGFYAYRERIAETPALAGVETPCALVPETALATPEVITGRGEHGRVVALPAPGPRTPTRVRVPSLGIDAPVQAVGIDVAGGVLDAPSDIASAGWWRDGALPGDRAGSTLIAGHVDSATAGAGAFFALHRARPGALVRLVTADGRARAYRVVSVASYRKQALPASLFSRLGPARLVLVTCGGPFIAAARHYRDNIVVVARPAR